MISTLLQEEIAAAVIVQAHGKMGIAGIEPSRHEYWQVWAYTPGVPRLRLFLVMLRGNVRGFTFEVQHVFDVAAIHRLREWYPVTIEKEVFQLLCDYGRFIGMSSFCIGEVSVPIQHPLFEATDRLWLIQPTFEKSDQDVPVELPPTLVWLHDGAIYLVCGWNPLLENIAHSSKPFLLQTPPDRMYFLTHVN